MTKRQRVFFWIGAWACLVTAAIHLVGHFAPPPPPANTTEAELWRLLTTYEKDFGAGFSRTTADFLKGFSLCFSLFLLWAGAWSLLSLRRGAADPAWLRRVVLFNALFSAALLAVSLTYFFLPPIVCVAVIFLGCAGAALPAGSAVQAA
ncbi:MAG TPA: hypothetical protein VIB08_11865 [Thermoanaerobaculia bacterium]